MNVRLAVAASLVLSTLVLVPGASACQSSIYVVQHYVCEGNTPDLPCLSVDCIVDDAVAVVTTVRECAAKITAYDPAHDPLLGFQCFTLSN